MDAVARAKTAGAHRVFDPVPVLEEATAKKTATADDWLRLALARKPDDLDGARGKVPPAAFFGALAVLLETPAGKDFAPRLANPAEKRTSAWPERGRRSCCATASTPSRSPST